MGRRRADRVEQIAAVAACHRREADRARPAAGTRSARGPRADRPVRSDEDADLVDRRRPALVVAGADRRPALDVLRVAQARGRRPRAAPASVASRWRSTKWRLPSSPAAGGTNQSGSMRPTSRPSPLARARRRRHSARATPARTPAMPGVVAEPPARIGVQLERGVPAARHREQIAVDPLRRSPGRRPRADGDPGQRVVAVGVGDDLPGAHLDAGELGAVRACSGRRPRRATSTIAAISTPAARRASAAS